MIKTTIKTPKCPKCINPILANYYQVGKMKRAYIRINEKWTAIGYYCKKHNYFPADFVYKNNREEIKKMVKE